MISNRCLINVPKQKEGSQNRLPLVANQHNDHIRVGVLTCVLKPGGEVVECVPSGDVVH